MENIILHSTSLKDFKEIIRAIVEDELRKFKPEQPQPANSEYATRRAVCDRLKFSLSTLHYYTKNGILTGHRIGSRVLYKWAEVEQSVKRIETIKYKHRGV